MIFIYLLGNGKELQRIYESLFNLIYSHIRYLHNCLMVMCSITYMPLYYICDLVLVTSGGRFNIRRRSLALAGSPISAKNGGVRLFGTVRLIGRIVNFCTRY